MADNTLGMARRTPLAGIADKLLSKDDKQPKEDGDEEACQAYSFLRGLRDRASAIEFRFQNGNSEFLSYCCLVSFAYNPSVGILLRFTADIVTLVLIRGSNLDTIIPGRDVNLTDRGLQRHRITRVREMSQASLQRVPAGEPTVDRIEIQEFESLDDQRAWLNKYTPAFMRPQV